MDEGTEDRRVDGGGAIQVRGGGGGGGKSRCVCVHMEGSV